MTEGKGLKSTGVLLIILFAAFLSGCGPVAIPAATQSPPISTEAPTSVPFETPTSVPTSTPEPTAAPTEVSAPTATQPTPTEAPTPVPTPTPPSTAVDQLVAIVEASLPPTPTPDASGLSAGGFDGVEVLPLTAGVDGQPVWAVFTHGSLSYDSPEDHFLAIYADNEAGWGELDRFKLECADTICSGSVRQAPVEPSKIWLEVQGEAGAYSGCYDLLSFDGQALRAEVSNWGPIPDLGELMDLNGDGTLEVVLNASDPYVLSRSHGVRYIRFQVLRWDGSQFVGVELSPLPASAQADLGALNHRGLELAQAGLWLDAQTTMDQALTLAPDEPTVIWNAALIRLYAESNREQVRSSSYPLLTHVFLGDYAAALEVMRPYSAEEIFSPLSPVLGDADAFTWEDALSYWITFSASRALEARPDLAAAYYLRGWAIHLVDPDSPEVLADIERAAELDPDEPLFSQSVSYLK